MKTAFLGLLFFVGLLVLGVVVYSWPETHRYRMTVEVETPQGVRSGSSVVEVKEWREIRIFPDQHLAGGSLRGEAVAVDLPDGQTLYALLRGERSGFGDLLRAALGPFDSPAQKVGSPPKALPRRAPVGGGDTMIPTLPMLVRFRDPTIPASVERVDPDNLAASFGAGIRLRRITMQSTEDPVTKGILNKLFWLPCYYDRMLDGVRGNNSQRFNNSLGTQYFLSQGE